MTRRDSLVSKTRIALRERSFRRTGTVDRGRNDTTVTESSRARRDVERRQQFIYCTRSPDTWALLFIFAKLFSSLLPEGLRECLPITRQLE